jgi:vacuolar protein sorting-associated protein 72
MGNTSVAAIGVPHRFLDPEAPGPQKPAPKPAEAEGEGDSQVKNGTTGPSLARSADETSGRDATQKADSVEAALPAPVSAAVGSAPETVSTQPAPATASTVTGPVSTAAAPVSI